MSWIKSISDSPRWNWFQDGLCVPPPAISCVYPILIALFIFFTLTPTYETYVAILGMFTFAVGLLFTRRATQLRASILSIDVRDRFVFALLVGFIVWSLFITVIQRRVTLFSRDAWIYFAAFATFPLAYVLGSRTTGFYRGILFAIFTALLMHLLIIAANVMFAAINSADIRNSIKIGRLFGSIVVDSILWFLVALYLGSEKIRSVRRLIPLSGLLVIFFIMALLVTRNGFIVLIGNLWIFFRVSGYSARTDPLIRNLGKILSIFAVCATAMSVLYLDSYRTKQLFISVEHAVNRSANEPWINDEEHPYEQWCETLSPKFEPCVVDQSVYYRLSWLMSSMRFVTENPAGIGYSRTPFGDALKIAFSDAIVNPLNRSHSHSGLVDIAILFGLPGFILLSAFLAACIYRAWQLIKFEGSFVGYAILFLTSSFILRSAVDSILQGQALVFYLCTIGLLLGLASNHTVVKRNMPERVST